MSELLSIEWGETGVRGVAGRTSGGRVTIQSTFDLVWPDDARPGENDDRAGALLRERIDAIGCRTRDVSVGVPRSSAVVRRLDLPAVPEAELPQMVRMQAATRASSTLEQQALDFVPIAAHVETGLSVLATTVSRGLVDAVTSVCAAAQLNPAGIGLSSLAVAELVARQLSAEGGSFREHTGLVISVTGELLQSTLVQSGELVFTQSTELNLDDSQFGTAVAANIKRTLLANGDGTTAADLDRLWIVGGDDTNVWLPALELRLAVPFERLDPFDNMVVSNAGTDAVKAREAYAGCIGRLLVEPEPHVPQLDFVNPRQPPKEVDHTRRRLVVGAAAAATVLIGAWGLWWWRLASLDAEIATLTREESDLTQYVRQREDVRKSAGVVRSWKRLQIDWLEKLDGLGGYVPDRSAVLFEELHLIASPTSPTGELSGDVVARDRPTVEDLTQSFAESGFEVEPAEVSVSRGGGPRPYRFPLKLRLPSGEDAASDSGKGGAS